MASPTDQLHRANSCLAVFCLWRRNTAKASLACGIALTTPLIAQDTTIRLVKPENVFFYPQLNLQAGYDSNEPGDGWGFADRGSRTQLALEWFVKDEERLQRGYTRLIEPIAWNVKFALELDPEEDDAQDLEPRIRPFDTWVQLDTKWDRTSIWLGQRSIPYGHNPRLDPSHTFLPNQADLDLSFGRDTGVFAKTPWSREFDLEIAVTAGKGDTWDYHGGWLVTARIGRPTFVPNEWGLFAVAGKIQRTSGARTTNRTLTDIARVGVDLVHKHDESWKLVNQVSVGSEHGGGTQDRLLFNLLDTFEWYAKPGLTIGVTHALRHDKLQQTPSDGRTKGSLFGSISVAINRDVRLRINPFLTYHDSTGTRDSGAFIQLCFGCGLIK